MQVQQTETNSKKQKNPEMDQCIQNCLSCFKICEETLTRCFTEIGHKDSNHLALLKSCAEICNTSAKFMMLNSKFHSDVCGVCSKVCTECADSCEALGDSSMKECIEACRKCADSCAEMAKMPH
ncbi:four-helix bundle copper-binding protein [Bacteriovorax sp. PP10]|uniref:Four-helix bundle copper-binding protein n=1 Tax=Bacteriovorax antarcticus TaxID=3088717 RepID=A0ABU5VZJ1_9BACT|nr:four-helix bundle copper-binding protein [Bacteriovorax sp. PP10]MEA9358477.1 four-helix bundle copper-binding protein [Bacteriovorax sp. PP10]